MTVMAPQLTPPREQDRAPEAAWRPLSGMAVAAFVLSLLCILASALVWWAEALPILLGVLTLVLVSADRRRGRALAVWAIIIGVLVASCSFVAQSDFRKSAERTASSILSALASDATDEEKDAALAPWLHAPVLKTDVRQKIRERFAKVEAAYGAYLPPPSVGSIFSGAAGIFAPRSNVEEVFGEPGVAKPMQAMWVTVNFERGPLYMALTLLGGSMSDLKSIQGKLEPGAPMPVVSNVRFFKKKGP